MNPAISVYARILLLNIDQNVTERLADSLEYYGFMVTVSRDVTIGLQRAEEERTDLVIAALHQSESGGIDVVQQIRSRSAVPLLMLVDHDNEDIRIHVLEGGADAVLPKTVSCRELLARIRNLLRRRHPENSANTYGACLAAGAIRVYTGMRLATLNGVELNMTPAEFTLLLVLLRQRGQVKTREQLHKCLPRRMSGAQSRCIDVHIGTLRKKLGDSPRNPKYIRTIRNSGYVLVQQGHMNR